MTSPQRWKTGGRRRSASHYWGRSHSSFATHRPIKAWGQTTHLCTSPQTFLSSLLDAFCISRRMDRLAGLQPNPSLHFTDLFFFKCLNVQPLLEVSKIIPEYCSATVLGSKCMILISSEVKLLRVFSAEAFSVEIQILFCSNS